MPLLIANEIAWGKTAMLPGKNNGVAQSGAQKMRLAYSRARVYTCEDPRRLPPHALGVRDTSSEAAPAVSQWGPPRLREGDVGDPSQHTPPPTASGIPPLKQ